jgi:microbial collagenase
MDNKTITASGAWKSSYASVAVEEGVKKLVVTLTDSGGDPELYVRADQNPTVYTYSCKSITAGTKTEQCEVAVSSPKTYFIRVRTKNTTTVTVKAKKS